MLFDFEANSYHQYLYNNITVTFSITCILYFITIIENRMKQEAEQIKERVISESDEKGLQAEVVKPIDDETEIKAIKHELTDLKKRIKLQEKTSFRSSFFTKGLSIIVALIAFIAFSTVLFATINCQQQSDTANDLDKLKLATTKPSPFQTNSNSHFYPYWNGAVYINGDSRIGAGLMFLDSNTTCVQVSFGKDILSRTLSQMIVEWSETLGEGKIECNSYKKSEVSGEMYCTEMISCL